MKRQVKTVYQIKHGSKMLKVPSFNRETPLSSRTGFWLLTFDLREPVSSPSRTSGRSVPGRKPHWMRRPLLCRQPSDQWRLPVQSMVDFRRSHFRFLTVTRLHCAHVNCARGSPHVCCTHGLLHQCSSANSCCLSLKAHNGSVCACQRHKSSQGCYLGDAPGRQRTREELLLVTANPS